MASSSSFLLQGRKWSLAARMILCESVLDSFPSGRAWPEGGIRSPAAFQEHVEGFPVSHTARKEEWEAFPELLESGK